MRLRRLAGITFRLAVIAGLAGTVWAYRGRFGDVTEVLQSAGWWAVVAIGLWHFLSLGLCALAQRALFGGGRINTFLLGRWVRESVGELAGFLPLSGEVAVARILALRGIGALAGST